jgi:transcriptional regulator with XRE-family HTH domain
MSSIISIIVMGVSLMLSFYYGSVLAVDSKGLESLADFVRRARIDKRLSLGDVERLSGRQISDSYVSRIENGDLFNPSTKKLRALARGLQISEDILFSIARGRSVSDPTEMENRLLTMFRQMPDHWKEDFLRILQGLHEQHAVHNDKVKNIASKKRKPRAA